VTHEKAAKGKAQVRFTEAAISDLHRLLRKDPQIVRACFKKFLLLERNPQAGEPLLGGLIGFRKLTVGDRTWRIVWRVVTDLAGHHVVEVAEVWAVGARKDSQVYGEVSSRVATLGSDPLTRPLTEVLQALSRVRALRQGATVEVEEDEAGELGAPPPRAEPIPGWLSSRLIKQAGISEAELAGMTPEGAMDVWDAWMSRPQA